MRIIILLASINYGTLAFAPQATPKPITSLAARREDGRVKNVMGGAAAFLIGLFTAGQVTLAEPSIIIDHTFQTGASSTIVSIGAPSFSAGSSFDTLDFSLPSYDEATKGSSSDSSSKTPKSAPTFTVDFPELKLPREDTSADEAAAKKAVEEDKAAKAKAKEEARLAKEKEAAEKAAAEEKKKAEQAARREAEKKKQEEMVARQRAAEEKAIADAAKVAEDAAASVSSKKVEVAPPPAPKPAPVSAPAEVSVPEFKLPEFTAPDIKVPSFSAPKFEAPKLDAPKFETPSAPTISLPKSPPSFDLDIKTPQAPVPSFSSPPPKVVQEVVQVPLESQEIRDAKARAAKEKFKDLDDEARAFEKKAQETRELAKVAKKEAKIAKDEACETRPGGKVLCIRPFGIGY